MVQIHSYFFSLWRKVHQNNHIRQLSFYNDKRHFEISWATEAEKVWQFCMVSIFLLNPKGLLMVLFPNSYKNIFLS